MKLLQYILPPLALLGTLTACRDYDGSYQDYFNDYAQACQQLSSQIAQTDSEIDIRVYALYGLTEEELEIVTEI